ncbi:cytochrome c oxidase assembly factor 8 [Osmerus mordax]|uniref:C14orf153 n=1 Tax=Osmerus mordax TaxID=8014 RepID=C1BJU5_OSMMO|nr:C14orf153 precursor [Osmerus mordax]
MTSKRSVCLSWRSLYLSYRARPPSSIFTSRQCHSNQTSHNGTFAKRSEFTPSADSKHDWMGPPDRLSNLRPILYHIPENETELEKLLRKLRQDTEDWNHEFWAKQNVTFSKEKDAFIVSKLQAQGLSERDEKGRKRALNSEEMAVFYKSFLDTNRIRHSSYNKEWYRRNFTITMLMGRVALNNIWKKITERRGSKRKEKDTI